MVMNHYLLLGLQVDADSQQIKAAYRRMAKRFHPDTNQGSEAAAELFRQLSEAYRVLTDAKLRTVYDAELRKKESAVQQREQAEKKVRQQAAQTAPAPPEPKQKFNHFLNSLLDALFEAPEHSLPQSAPKDRAPPQKKTAATLRKNPDFNFYYYLAMEKKAPPYSCGEDGVYRRSKPTSRQRVNNAATAFSRSPGVGLLVLVCSSLWSSLSP